MNDTFQLVLSTDGKRSFAAFLFNAPQVFSSLWERDDSIGAGFDGGRSTGMSADVKEFLISNGMQLAPFSLYRIDGMSLSERPHKLSHQILHYGPPTPDYHMPSFHVACSSNKYCWLIIVIATSSCSDV